MKELKDYRDSIRKCSKCGICQAACPIYKETGNDCTVSRGLFVMLEGVLKGELKPSKKLKHYLDLCIKCDLCSKCCPSGINVMDIVSAANYEFYKKSVFRKITAFLTDKIFFSFLPEIISVFKIKQKSKVFEKKVLYFGGCGSKILGDENIIKILNKCNIEVINPNFGCCGVTAYASGDLPEFKRHIKDFINTIRKYDISEVITSCSSCEKTIKSYVRFVSGEDKILLESVNFKNIYSYIRANNLRFELKNPSTVTFHKPCNMENYSDAEWIMNNTQNLTYVKMKDFDTCCNLNGLFNSKNKDIMSKICEQKRNNIIASGAKTVLTTCIGCQAALNMYSHKKYEVQDLLDFLIKNSVFNN